jgi:hypothetical protein
VILCVCLCPCVCVLCVCVFVFVFCVCVLCGSENSEFALHYSSLVLYSRGGVFTARYGPSPCIDTFSFKRLN